MPFQRTVSPQAPILARDVHRVRNPPRSEPGVESTGERGVRSCCPHRTCFVGRDNWHPLAALPPFSPKTSGHNRGEHPPPSSRPDLNPLSTWGCHPPSLSDTRVHDYPGRPTGVDCCPRRTSGGARVRKFADFPDPGPDGGWLAPGATHRYLQVPGNASWEDFPTNRRPRRSRFLEDSTARNEARDSGAIPTILPSRLL